MADNRIVKAGPITLALGLIIGGLLLLLLNFGVISRPDLVWKLWPLLLIGLDVEYFLRRALHKEGEVHLHAASVALIILVIVVGGLLHAATFAGKNLDRIIDGFAWHDRELTYSRTWATDAVGVKRGQELFIENPRGRVELLPADDAKLHVEALINSPASGPERELAKGNNPEISLGDTITIRVPDRGIESRRTFTDLKVLAGGGGCPG